jgi:cellulose synthase operon protein C
MSIPIETIDRVKLLYDRGLHLQAYQTAIAHAPLAAWRDTNARIMAGRIAMQVGAQRLGGAYHLRAWRNNRRSPQATYYYARVILSRQGLLAAWEFVRSIGEFDGATPRERAEWWTFRAHLLTEFRDFDAAGEWLAKSMSIDPENYWVYVSRGRLLEAQDRYEEAIDAANLALNIKPNDPAAISISARMSILLEREDEALERLKVAAAQTESNSVVLCLAQLQNNLGDYVGAGASFQRSAEISPLLEPGGKQWLLARQSDIAYSLGDFATASQLAELVNSPSYQKVAERLQAEPLIGKRILLPVGFVRQHHVTCAPATLATLSRFWDRPVDFQTIAAEICYDGTSNYRQRLWAGQNGWIAREFTVTWDSAVAAIDRGIPFTLSTTEVTSAHLQAVIGYDSYLRQFLIRDPYHQEIGEMWAIEALEHYALFGPRGMILVPDDRPELLVGLDLPDAELYDLSYALQHEIERHQRAAAIQIHQQMVELAPNHRLTLYGERSIAGYDSNETHFLAVTEKLLEQFPDRPNLILDKLNCLKELTRREERLELLETVCAQPYPHPIFWQYYAQELSDDGRSAAKTIELLKQAIRYLPTNAENYYLLANSLWVQRESSTAFELYRFATCLNDKYSKYAKAYFFTARHHKQPDLALKLLERRWTQFGSKSEEPVLTLFWAYCQLNRQQEAFEILDRACLEQPYRGDLLIGAANAYAEYGKYQQAADLLDRTRDKVARSTWLRTAAELASNQGDLSLALAHWQEILSIDPLAIDAIRSVVSLLAETQDSATAIGFLQANCERFPHSYSLHQLWSSWLESEDISESERVLWLLTEINPSDAWTRRQLAWILGKQRKFSQAFTELALARQLDPHSSTERTIFGDLCERSGELTAAKEAYREAIRLSIDSDGAISSLINLCYAREERQTALAFIFAELTHQVTFGDGLIIYQELAAQNLDPLVVLEQMREAWVQRSDLWQSWSVVILQLLQLDRLDEALETAETYVQQFPLLAKAWLDLSTVHRERDDVDREMLALHRALEINPTWNIPIGRLTRLYERTAQIDLAQELLTTAIARDPREFSHHCYLAEVLWNRDNRQDALNQLETLIKTTRSGYSYSWAWDKLREWSIECERPEFADRLARELTQTRSKQALSWYLLAQTLSKDEDLVERLQGLDRAIELNPYYVDAYDLKARLLTYAEEYEAALSVCNTTAWGDDRPTSLRARVVWIEQQCDRDRDAIAHLHEIVAIEPDFEWAWMQLAKYFDRLDDLENYLPAAKKLVELDPQCSLNWGYFGDALHRTDDIAGAQAAWEKSIAIDPSYEYGALSLFQLHWFAKNFAAAAETLALTRPHLTPLTYLPNELRLAMQSQDIPTAAKALAELCLCESDSGEELSAAMEIMESAGLSTTVETILFQQLQAEDSSSWLPLFWMKTAARLGAWEKCDRYVTSQDFDTSFGQAIVRIYMRILGKHQQRKILLNFIRDHRDALRREDSLWGIVGFALRLVQENRQIINWLEDWHSRSAVEPWMLVNLAEAFRAVGADDRGHNINKQAISLPDGDESASNISWLTFDLAIAGNIEKAIEYMQLSGDGDSQPEYQFLIEITHAVIAARSKMSDSNVKQKTIEDRLSAAKTAYPEFTIDVPFDRAYIKSLKQIAISTYSLPIFWQWLQETWRYFKQHSLNS